MRLYGCFHAVHEDIKLQQTGWAMRLRADPPSLRLDADICVNINTLLTALIYCFGQSGRGATNFHLKKKERCEKGMCEGK